MAESLEGGFGPPRAVMPMEEEEEEVTLVPVIQPSQLCVLEECNVEFTFCLAYKN
jgi:hypothetical protein